MTFTSDFNQHFWFCLDLSLIQHVIFNLVRHSSCTVRLRLQWRYSKQKNLRSLNATNYLYFYSLTGLISSPLHFDTPICHVSLLLRIALTRQILFLLLAKKQWVTFRCCYTSVGKPFNVSCIVLIIYVMWPELHPFLLNTCMKLIAQTVTSENSSIHLSLIESEC